MAPCDKPIAESYVRMFFIAGPDVSRSRKFTIESNGTSVVARVSPGSRTARTPGVVLTTIGGSAVLGGLGLIVFGLAEGSSKASIALRNDQNLNVSQSYAGFVTAGGVMAGVGGGFLVAGLIAIGSSVTSVELSDANGPVESRIRRVPGPTLGLAF